MPFEPEKLISGERKNFRDLHWCTIVNEPVILTYEGQEPRVAACSECDWKASPDDEVFLQFHPFLFHIYRYTGEDKG